MRDGRKSHRFRCVIRSSRKRAAPLAPGPPRPPGRAFRPAGGAAAALRRGEAGSPGVAAGVSEAGSFLQKGALPLVVHRRVRTHMQTPTRLLLSAPWSHRGAGRQPCGAEPSRAPHAHARPRTQRLPAGLGLLPPRTARAGIGCCTSTP